MIFKATDRNCFRLAGRSIVVDGLQYLNFSGSYLEFTTTASKISVRLKSVGFADAENLYAWAASFVMKGECEGGAYKVTEPTVRFQLKPDTTADYVIYESEKPEKITVRFLRMTEAAFAKMGVESFEIDCDEQDEATWPKPTTPLNKKIEFVGDSITCGYGNEGVLDVDTFTTTQENPVMAYAMTTARNLDAEYQLCSWSGIGVISSWIPEDINEPLNDWLMPVVYPYVDAGWSKELGLSEAEFETYDGQMNPDVVVINLGTNDCSYTRFIEERVNAFGKLYHDFMKEIRKRNPEAIMVCSLGIMGQELCDEIEKQVGILKEEGDEKIYFYKFDVQDPADGIGADSHPTIATHQKRAAAFSEYLNDLMNR